MRSKLWIAVMGAAMLAGCAPKPETAEQMKARMDAASAAAKTAIDSLELEYATHFNMAHADVVAGYYTEQAHMMGPNGPALVGRKAIAGGLAGMAAMKPALKLTGESVLSDGMEALERGAYTFTFTLPGAKEPMSDTGKYLRHWQQVEGHWLLADDIWNSDLPAMPMAAPAPAKKP